ncbi:MAG: methylated-DNA--[protein]-cysteine S-methyltransferase [Candidatus Heimdallarchaeaceae archaeon]|jgi:methylated-DNA-[protein]-cysteine S-methyltransferase
MTKKYIGNYETPIGNVEIITDEKQVLACNFRDRITESEEKPEILKKTLNQVEEYFQRKRENFDLDFSLSGTDFQVKVWQELTRIPYGQVISYKELASRIKQQDAVRAVGNANGKNPISIIIPCHRVIGSDGDLVGYGGGIERKKWLLDFESN